MSIEMMAIAGLAGLVLIIFLMVNLKDSDTAKKLNRYERIIDDINRQNHKIKRELEIQSNQKKQLQTEIEERVNMLVKEKVQESVMPLLTSMREIEGVMQVFQDEQSERLDRIEERSSKDISFLPSQVAASNEKLIIAQYATGKSEAAIAKDLRIGIGEVDLVLKLANLK
ncbi:MAG: hypothetical protein IBX44_05050 [Sulfurospirillum sp.]|nr:hypothetical protein [Sulfurospirillum sp.]